MHVTGNYEVVEVGNLKVFALFLCLNCVSVVGMCFNLRSVTYSTFTETHHGSIEIITGEYMDKKKGEKISIYYLPTSQKHVRHRQQQRDRCYVEINMKSNGEENTRQGHFSTNNIQHKQL